MSDFVYVAPPTLGCGTYDVYFKTRGGQSNVCRALNVTSISFNRTLNDTSQAAISVTTNGVTEECCRCYSEIRPWKHELAIYRDSKLVWDGPITNIVHRQGGLIIDFTARDLSAWFDKRLISIFNTDYEVEDVDIKEVFQFLVNLAYTKDPWNMTWEFFDTGIPITKFYPGYFAPDRWGGLYTIIGDEIRDLTRSGIDWTIVNRNMVAGNLEIGDPNTPALMFTDQVWQTIPDITIEGGGMATSVGVAGGQGGFYGYADDQMWIEDPADTYRSEYGLIEAFFQEDTLDEEDSTVTPNAITQNAHGRRELKKAPFISISSGTLSSEAPFDFSSLIPGTRAQLRLGQTCLSLSDAYRLYSIDVSVDNKKGEQVNTQLAPIGVDDVIS